MAMGFSFLVIRRETAQASHDKAAPEATNISRRVISVVNKIIFYAGNLICVLVGLILTSHDRLSIRYLYFETVFSGEKLIAPDFPTT